MKLQKKMWKKIDEAVLQHSVVDTTIKILGQTVLRPLSIACASLLALAGFSYTYIIAYQTGFALSGSELWFYFIGGWMIGMAIEATTYLLNLLNK